MGRVARFCAGRAEMHAVAFGIEVDDALEIAEQREV
jgi:hypothetical protein